MKTAIRATEQLHEMGQSLWLDNITRGLITTGTLNHYIQELSVTGLTSNPTIFDHAIKNSDDYDDAISRKVKEGKSGRGAFLRAGARGSAAGRRSVSANPRRDRRSGRLGVARGLAPPGPRHGRHHRRGQGPSCPGRPPESFHQDTGYSGGTACHRGGHLRGCASQCDLAVFVRAISGRSRRVSQRDRAAGCRRA